MSTHAEDKAEKQSGLSTRALVAATVGIFVILGLAVLVVAVVAPLRQTHAVVRDYAKRRVSWKEVSERLGGWERGARRLATYLCLPRWMGTDRTAAVLLLGEIGAKVEVRECAAGALVKIRPGTRAAVPALVKALGDTDALVRYHAAYALGRIGPEAKTSVPALEKLSADVDSDVRRVTAEALKKIRGGE